MYKFLIIELLKIKTVNKYSAPISFFALGSTRSLIGPAGRLVPRRRRSRSPGSLTVLARFGPSRARGAGCGLPRLNLLALLVLLDQFLNNLIPHGPLPLVLLDDGGDPVVHADRGVDDHPRRQRVGQVAHSVGPIGVSEGDIDVEPRGELLIVAHYGHPLHLLSEVAPPHDHRIGGEVGQLDGHYYLVGLPRHVLPEEGLVDEPIVVDTAPVEYASELFALHSQVQVYHGELLALGVLPDYLPRQHHIHLLTRHGLDHTRAQTLVF